MIIRRLTPTDAPSLSAMLLEQPQDYIQYFIPFSFEPEDIESKLEQATNDLFMGMFWQGEIAGFFMLRGWDAGYEVPSYGVVIARHFAGKGLGKLSLEASKSICRLSGVTRMMLKVHPDNHAAKHIYEAAGFVQTGVDQKINNLIYHYEFI